MRLECCHALVTGASAGIGREFARQLAGRAASLLLVARREDRLEELRAELIAHHPNLQVEIRLTDLSRHDEVDTLIAATSAREPAIDFLVNNAGLGGTASVVDMTDEQWSSVLDVTLTSTFRATRAVLRHMVPARGGVIINNSSVIGWRAQQGQAHYAAAKAGVMALTRCAAIEAAPHGVRVNAVAPSLAMHPFLAKVTTDELLAELTEREAFGRYAEPWEIANVMVFLASDYSSYLTGEVISASSQRA